MRGMPAFLLPQPASEMPASILLTSAAGGNEYILK